MRVGRRSLGDPYGYRADEDDDDEYEDEYEQGEADYGKEEYTEEEKDQHANRCLRVANIFLMLFGGVLAGIGLLTGHSGYGGAWTGYAVAGLGSVLFFVCLLGLIGALRSSPQMLRFYYTCMIFAAMGLLVLGGFSFIVIRQAQNYIETHWDRIVADASTSERADLDLEDAQAEVKRNLIITGLFCFFTLFITLSVLSNVVRLVSKVSAYSIMLQSGSITLLPFGVALIAAGLFIADTAATVEAPVTAFAIFILGVFVIMLALLGCFGVTIESRGILKLYMYFVFVLSVLFIVFGVVALVQSDTLKKKLTDKWESIRRVLPPTFSGKFDKEQFEIFLESNLLLLGFLAICTGILLGIQWYASLRLRAALKQASQEAAMEGPPLHASVGDQPDSRPNRMKVMWKQQWTKGSKKSRRRVKLVCCCIVFLFISAIILATLALYFATSCASISDFEEIKTYHHITSDVFAHSNYTRGLTHVTIDDTRTDAAIVFTKSAFREGLQAKGFPPLQNSTTFAGVVAQPKEKTRVMGFDISCQLADLDVQVPAATHYGGNDYSHSLVSPALWFNTFSDRAGIEVDLGSYPINLRPRFRSIVASTTSGPIDFTNMHIGQLGTHLTSDLGELTLDRIDGSCDPDLLGTDEAGLRLFTRRGAISIVSSTLYNCPVHAVGAEALVRVADTTSTNDGGGSLLSIIGDKGLIELETVSVDVFDLKSSEGSVRATNVNGTQFKAASVSGSVEALNILMPVRGLVQAETDTGAITISLSRFAGIVNIITSGSISCTGDGFDELTPGVKCPITPVAGYNHVKQANINCATKGDCLYSGSVTLTSSSGSISLHAEPWVRPLV